MVIPIDRGDAAVVGRLIDGVDEALRLKVFHVIGEFGAEIVGGFYEQLRTVPEIAGFFDHGVVEDRLSWVMRLWLTELFFYPRGSADVEALIARQVEVGKRHSVVNVPLSAMQMAVAELKRALFQRLIATGLEPARLTEAILYVNEMVDWAVGIINRTCVRDMLADVRDQQTLKLQIFNVDMALQTESLRSSLFDWHRQILRLLYDDGVALDCFPALRRTNLGLWILHKGDLMLPDTVEIGQLKHIVEQIDGCVRQAVRCREEAPPRELRATLTAIDQYVNSAASILGTISDRMLTLEGGRDPLTKLFNRRFLRTILQREVKLSVGSGDRFAAIMVDIDYFKLINDRYGHAAGDSVLRQFSELLSASVRAGDFVFRYGGEEFLVIVASVDAESVPVVADKICAMIRRHRFKLLDEAGHVITASLGVALHDGHPDYGRVVDQADCALLKAKQSGRNRWMLFEPEAEDECQALKAARAPSDAVCG